MKNMMRIMLIMAMFVFFGCKGTTDGETGFVDITSPTVGVMKAITGGEFLMGENVEPITRKTTVSNFYLGKTEVTQGQWEAVMKDVYEKGTNLWPGASNNFMPSEKNGMSSQHPAYYVSWFDAVEFCNALSKKERLKSYYTIDKTLSLSSSWTVTINTDANGYRLPTQAEWEFAAGGGAGSVLAGDRTTYAGTNIDSNKENLDDLGDYAWYYENSGYKSHAVGTKKANSLGLHDMTGNIREWCYDWYELDYDITDSYNPLGPESGTYRIACGGHFNLYSELRIACKSMNRPNSYLPIYGFRVARNAE